MHLHAPPAGQATLIHEYKDIEVTITAIDAGTAAITPHDTGHPGIALA